MTRDEARQFLQSLWSFMAEDCNDDQITSDEDDVMALVAREAERCARIAREVSAEYPTGRGLQKIGSWIAACDEIEERIKKPVV